LLEHGDHVVAAGALYGGSVSMLAVNLARLGIETTFVDGSSADAFAAAMRPRTRAVFAESLGNPSLAVLDVAAVADVAHAHGVPLIVDNTVPSPYLCNPIAFGADIVVHSATKYLGGHGTTLAGVMVESGRFPWDNGKFPGMTEPSRGYHGVKFFETFGDFGFTMRARMETLRVHGAALSPMSAWQILQGVETLPLRMERHCANALAVAEFLRGHCQHCLERRAHRYARAQRCACPDRERGCHGRRGHRHLDGGDEPCAEDHHAFRLRPFSQPDGEPDHRHLRRRECRCRPPGLGADGAAVHPGRDDRHREGA
jgi:O-acetylhomoserine/O-acetylserine sulfhydrylase-like pyridoxal-dependent enzyme